MKQNSKFKKTEAGLIPEDWEIKKIGDVAQLIKETINPSNEENMVYIGLEHIGQGTLSLIGIGNSSDIISNKFKFKKGQILFGKLRPYFKKVFRPNFSGVCSTDIWVIDSKEGFDNNFLFYFFADNRIIEKATNSSEGTRMPRARWDYISNLEFSFPPFPEQHSIAHILSTLDEKIELLQKQNKTLEAIGQAIFKKWFVDEKKEEWEEDKMKNLAEVDWGDTHITKSSYITKGYTAYSASGPDGFRSKFDYDKSGIVLSAIGAYCGKTWWAQGKWSCIKNTIRIFGKTIPSTYLYFLTKNKSFWQLRGAAQPFISKGDINNTIIIIPDRHLLDKFNDITLKLFDKIFTNNQQIQTLTQIRDLLLPKLMSGKIRVPLEER